MEYTYLSSKGQVVIPKAVRDAVGLKQGSRLRVEVTDGSIVLTPTQEATPDDLYGCLKGFDLLSDLRAERATELRRDWETPDPSSGAYSPPKSRRKPR